MSAEKYTSNWPFLLMAACDIVDWNRSTQTWKTSDGFWYSLNAARLAALEETLILLIQISKLGTDRQKIIADKGFDFIINILSCPEPPRRRDDYIGLAASISSHTWDLMFNLLSENIENQKRIWNECNGLFLNYLQQTDFKNKEPCRLIIYNMFVLGGEGRQEELRILKTLLQIFHNEKKTTPLKEQGLTMFLDYFVAEDKRISTMYEQLTSLEKVALLQFTIDRKDRENIDDSKCFPLSVDLLFRIRHEFSTKSEHTFRSSDADEELFAFFEVVAVISSDKYYKLNRFNFGLLMNVGRLLSYVQANEEESERMFLAIKRNSELPLLLLILTTISNLVRGNEEHKEMARDSGLIEILVDFIAARGTDIMLYRYTVFALIDICQTRPINMEYLPQIVKSKDHNGSEIFANLLIDITWKGRK